MYFCIKLTRLYRFLYTKVMKIEQLYELFKQHPYITTDSRDCPEGSIFFALKGCSFNGNQFAKSALDKGCSLAVIDEPEYAVDERCIVVDNCLRTLQLLARHHRRQFDIPVIGITGTNGKTTTKELVSAVLGERYQVLYTQGNFNNDIGVPKTLLRLNGHHEIAVIEMGASHPGDIKTLVELVEPDYGIITNVGRAHLQGFGSFEGVVKTKGELYDFLRTRPNSKVFIHLDNPHLTGMAQDLQQIGYGTDAKLHPVIEGHIDSCAPCLSFSYRESAGEWHHIDSHLIGSYNIYNMLAATCIGHHFGVTPEQIDHALAGYIPSNNRSQLELTGRNRLIVDAYNANPTSMAAALENFRIMQVDNKLAILGDMRELGVVSAEEHQKTVDYLQESPFCDVWLVGEEFGKTHCPFRKFRNVEEVEDELSRHCPENHCILIKGSNGIHLAQLKDKL